MSDTMYKMTGIFCIITSVFFLLGALFFPVGAVPVFIIPLCWALGLLLLAVGVVFYKVLKNEV